MSIDIPLERARINEDKLEPRRLDWKKVIIVPIFSMRKAQKAMLMLHLGHDTVAIPGRMGFSPRDIDELPQQRAT